MVRCRRSLLSHHPAGINPAEMARTAMPIRLADFHPTGLAPVAR
jgi:hypothetical protein